MKKYFRFLFVFILAFALVVVAGCGDKKDPEDEPVEVVVSAEQAYEELGATLVETAKDITALSIQGEANAKAVAAGEEDFTLKGEFDAQLDANETDPKYSTLAKIVLNGNPFIVSESYFYQGKEYNYNYSNLFSESSSYRCEESAFEKPDTTEFDAEFVSELVKKLVAAQLNVTASKKGDVLSINLVVEQSELGKLFSFVFAELNNGNLPDEAYVQEVLKIVKLNKCEFSIKLTGANKLEIDANVDADLHVPQNVVPTEGEPVQSEEPIYVDGNVKLDLTLDIIFNSASPKIDANRLAEIERYSKDVNYTLAEIEEINSSFFNFEVPFAVVTITPDDGNLTAQVIYDEENGYSYGKYVVTIEENGVEETNSFEVYCIKDGDRYLEVNYENGDITSVNEKDYLAYASTMDDVLEMYGVEGSYHLANLEHPQPFHYTLDVVDEEETPVINIEFVIEDGLVQKYTVKFLHSNVVVVYEANYSTEGYVPMDLTQVRSDVANFEIFD